MSFTEYLKEQEELQIVQAEEGRKEKLADFVKTIEDLNDEKFRAFAIDELGMEEAEAEVVVYKMLRDFLLAGDKDGDGEPDELGAELELGGEDDLEGIDTELSVDDVEVEEACDAHEEK